MEIGWKQRQRLKERSHNKQQRGHVITPPPHNQLRHIYASGLNKATGERHSPNEAQRQS